MYKRTIFSCIILCLFICYANTIRAQSSAYTTENDSHFRDTLISQKKNIISLDILIMFPALGYSRILPISEKSAVVLYGSITPFFGFLIDTGAALSLGRNRNFFEPGGGYLIHVDAFYLKAGYRYQGQKGFVFRLAPGYNLTENVPWFTASFGYAF